MTAAAEALVLAHLDLVERIAKSVAKHMPPWVDLEDLIAIGNLQLASAAERYDPDLNPSFASYASKGIRGRMWSAHRGRNYPRLTEGLPEDFADARIDPTPDPEQALIAKETGQDLETDIYFAERRLPVLERRVMRRHLAGQSMRDIGAKEDRSAAWAHGVIHRAKRKLRDNLREYDPERKAA